MKNTASILVLTFMIIGCQSLECQVKGEDTNNDVIAPIRIERVKGNVENIEKYSFTGKKVAGGIQKTRQVERIVYKYDERNYLKQKTRFRFEDTSPSNIWTYKYTGHLLTEIWYNELDSAGNETLSFIQYRFEQFNDTITQYIFKDHNSSAITVKYLCGSNGKEKKAITENGFTDFIYDKKGQLLRTERFEVYGEDFKPVETWKYKYNKKKDIVEEKSEYANESHRGSICTFTYKYDNHGNWVEKITEYENGTGMIEERKIKYKN